MAQPKKSASEARPARAPAKGSKPKQQVADAARSPKSTAPKAKAPPTPKASAAKKKAAPSAPAPAPKSAPAPAPKKAAAAKVSPAKPVAIAVPATEAKASPAKPEIPAARTSVKQLVEVPVAKAAEPAKVAVKPEPAPKPPEAKISELEFGTYRTRPPPPLPRLASQPPPAPSPPAPRPHITPSKGYQPIVTIQPFPRSTEPLNLTVGDKAVHPLHGLGEVSSIEHREVGGVSGDFYILRILDKGMRVMVPKNSASSSGLRAVMSEKDANAVLDTLRAPETAVDLQPWSRRFRAYTEMMKSGSPHEVAKVLRDMFRLKFDKDLSFGERRLLDQAKSLLMKELAAAKQISETDLMAQVNEMFKAT